MGIESVRWKGPVVGAVVGGLAVGVGGYFLDRAISPTTFGENHKLAKSLGCNAASVSVTLDGKTKIFTITEQIVNPPNGAKPYAVAGLDGKGNIIAGPEPIKADTFNNEGVGTGTFTIPEQHKFLWMGTGDINPVVLATETDSKGVSQVAIARCPNTPLVGEPATIASIPANIPSPNPSASK